MSAELLDLSAASAAAAIRAGEVDAHELFEFYRSRAAAEDLNAFLWLADAPSADSLSVDAPLAERAASSQGPLLHRGDSKPVGLKDP